MIRLKIDNIAIEISEGSSVLAAAELAGIRIPTMCFIEGFTNNPSCMVCLVKNKKNGELFASCATKVTEGMDILSEEAEVKEARREALELLLSDHVGDCEAPCRIACPAFMDIPQMNRLIASGKFNEALQIVKQEIALPLILGYVCSAPCEKVCRRASIDQAVSICQLKKFVAAVDAKDEHSYLPEKSKPSGKKVAIVGAGPAGLACAFYLTRDGHECVVFDRNEEVGGSLRNLPEMELPKQVLSEEIDIIQKYGIEFKLNQNITSVFFENELRQKFDSIVIAVGNREDQNDNILEAVFENLIVDKDTFTTDQTGVFACGSFVKKLDMAVKAVAQGKTTALSVNTFLNEKIPEKKQRMFNSKFGKLQPEEFDEYLKEATTDNRYNPANGSLDGYTPEEAILEAKRCMHCDCRKIDNCKLRIFSDEYQADRRKYLSGERKSIKKYNTHESIIYESEKCIKCGLCVEITVNEKEMTGLAFVGRGFDVRIDVPFTRTLGEALAKTAAKCADACPTGAISFRDKGES